MQSFNLKRSIHPRAKSNTILNNYAHACAYICCIACSAAQLRLESAMWLPKQETLSDAASYKQKQTKIIIGTVGGIPSIRCWSSGNFTSNACSHNTGLREGTTVGRSVISHRLLSAGP